MENKNEKKIEFLYAAIADAQEIIRFIDTKTAAAITLLGALFVGIYANLEMAVLHFSKFSCTYHLFLGLFVFTWLIGMWIVTRILFPTNNPIKNINFKGNDRPDKSVFFLAENLASNKLKSMFFNVSTNKLKDEFNNYKNEIANLTDNDIIRNLSLEVHKVNFIRNIKNQRFKFLVWTTIICAIFFSIQEILYHIDKKHIFELLKEWKK